MRGYIDLVFEHGDRFYLVDWKSNHLGSRLENYGPEALAAAMGQTGSTCSSTTSTRWRCTSI